MSDVVISVEDLSKRYRLYVTGSTRHFTESDITGPHQVGR